VGRESRNVQVADAELAPQESRLGDALLFAKKLFTKDYRAIAALLPSGAGICRRMAQQVDFSQAGVIVELGAGTGAITRAIVERVQPHHRLVIVERDPDFVDKLREYFPNHTVLRADATHMEEPLTNLGVRQVRYVFSGLATHALPIRGQVRLHRWLRRMLDPNGYFIQITHVPLHSPRRHVLQRYYSRLFLDVRFIPVWRHVPPGGVFICRKVRERITPKPG